MANQTTTTSSDAQVAVKITIAGNEEHRRFRLALKDLGASTLPAKLRQFLAIDSCKVTVFERYSDSSASYITLDSSNPAVYKQLYRAAKAKGKLRLRVTIEEDPAQASKMAEPPFHPDRLPIRSYMQPYVSDDGADQSPSSRISMLEDFKTLSDAPSTITLTPFTKSTVEQKKEQPHPYFWPVSDNQPFSENKTKFEKRSPFSSRSKVKQARQEDEDEAPVPGFFDFNDEQFVALPRESCPALSTDIATKEARDLNLANLAEVQHRHVAERQAPKVNIQSNFVIQCNNCENPIPNAHWHCSICDGGDFDLCVECVQKGCLCQHWMIQRFFKDGKIINSTTETLPPTRTLKGNEKKDIPGAFKSEAKPAPAATPERTCNACVQVFPHSKFIKCMTCDDFDLCLSCHVANKHGHNPGHPFEPVVKGTPIEGVAKKLLESGRNQHHYAICDGCDKNIYGIRHKCFNCPDWDYCSSCYTKASQTHPGHRFVQLHEPINPQRQPTQVHVGICCDGPLCGSKPTYIVGDRYKCAVCHDTDFCARCEALPNLEHNRTHPLLKFKTPVRNVCVTTYGEKANGETMRPMGDQARPTSSKSTETLPPAPSANAATQVQTIAEVKLAGSPKEEAKYEDKSAVKAYTSLGSTPLKAQFVRDTVTDGTAMAPSTQFTQTWTLLNPGPRTWPAGCSVCFVGGDSMLDVDSNHPSSIGQLNHALSTNTVDREVQKGVTVDFSVTMRTQEREGKSISYWRLKTANGTPFGHRLWCDVNVRQPAKAEDIVERVESPEVKAEQDTPVKQEEQQPKSSQMIFPKLDKESPVSSQHEAAPVVLVAAATLSPAGQDLLEEVESLELDGNEVESGEDVFLTDEEYELIGSDDEMEVADNGKK